MNFFIDNINILLLLPCLVCFIIGFNGLIDNKINDRNILQMSLLTVFLCIIFSVISCFFIFAKDLYFSENFLWLGSRDINFFIGTYLDKVSATFILIANLCVLIVQLLIYSFYKNAKNLPRLLFYLNLFNLGLNGIFLSSNLFQTYLFCEVIGVASYLLINFDFKNREIAKTGIKCFIYNRIADLTLLFCVLTILYFAVVYNQEIDIEWLGYLSLQNTAITISSLMSDFVFVFFCSLLCLSIIMKFMQSFVYFILEKNSKNDFSQIILYQNSLLTLVGIFLFLRFNLFFSLLDKNIIWLPLFLLLIFIILIFLNKIFVVLCKLIFAFEKYIVEGSTIVFGLFIRSLSYISANLQRGNFQSYIIYSLCGLVLIFALIFVSYITLLKM